VLDPGGPPFVQHGEKDWGPGQLVKSPVLDAQNWRFYGAAGNVNNGQWTNFTGNRSQLIGPPTSPQDILEIRWPTSLSGGSAPIDYVHIYPALASRLWIAMTFWFDPLWTNNGNIGTKFAFTRLGTTTGEVSNSNTNHYINLVNGQSALSDAFGFDTQFGSGGTNKSYSGFPASLLLDGKWHVIEFYLQLNSAPGVADGIYQVAVDGILRKEHRNVIYLGSGTPSNVRFNYLHLNSTYGGGPNSPPYNLFCYIDHIQFKSAP
jgi:hypothetical protein